MFNADIGKEMKYFRNVIQTATSAMQKWIDVNLQLRYPELFSVTRLPKELLQPPHDFFTK